MRSKKFYEIDRGSFNPKLEWLTDARKNYKDNKKRKEATEKLIKEGFLDQDDSNNYDLIFLGEYKKLYEQIKIRNEHEYHNLYTWIADNYVFDLVFDPLKDLIDNLLGIILDKTDLDWEFKDFIKYRITYYEIIQSYIAESIKLKNVYDEFVGKIGIDTEPIKKYPENADQQDRQALKTLAKISFIEREMKEGKFKKTEVVKLTDIVRELLRARYTNEQGFMFIKNYITGYNVKDANIQNYFREFRKDLPIINNV